MEQPWNEAEMRKQVMAWAVAAPRARASECEFPDGAGCYLAFVADDALLDVLAMYATGRAAVYAGSARSLRARHRRHDKTVREADALDESTIWWSVLPTETHAAATYVEAVLLDELRPPWNERGCSGFGNQHPGHGRIATARVSPWDVTFPGRSWAEPADLAHRVQARLALMRFLVEPDRHQLLWDPLVGA